MGLSFLKLPFRPTNYPKGASKATPNYFILTPPAAADITGLLSYLRPFGIGPSPLPL